MLSLNPLRVSRYVSTSRGGGVNRVINRADDHWDAIFNHATTLFT